MGTKDSPGRYDCYAKAEPDEPIFTLLARDPLAPLLVRLWADLQHRHTNNPTDNSGGKVIEAYNIAEQMDFWRMDKAPRKTTYHCVECDANIEGIGAYRAHLTQYHPKLLAKP